MTDILARLKAVNQAWCDVHVGRLEAPTLNNTINTTADAMAEIAALRARLAEAEKLIFGTHNMDSPPCRCYICQSYRASLDPKAGGDSG